MKRPYFVPLAAAAALALGAAPSMARPSRPGPPPVRHAPTAQDRNEGYQEANIALRYLDLTSKQRAKIHNIVDKYSRRIDEARRNRNLAPSKREDRIWTAHRNMREDVMKELTRDQRERVDSIARRQDRGGGWNGRDRGPSWRR